MGSYTIIFKSFSNYDTFGEPHFWIGKAYEKKDTMDFELALEAYEKSLNYIYQKNCAHEY
ncbi:MAG: hypothetical protein CM1200mP1_14090 [Candidatus Neomarinimicrobiota bacterium]|nr:MAG: hypothetical protein CM1200mP1_14090 [Candidatus Neomarinimicrobiota bacterium]